MGLRSDSARAWKVMAPLKPDAWLDTAHHTKQLRARVRTGLQAMASGTPVGNNLISFSYDEASVEQNVSTAARTVALTSPSVESSSHEKHGKPQECHERPVHHRHTTARACIGVRSPTRGGEPDSGSTFLPVSGLVGSSVVEGNNDGECCRPPLSHPCGRSVILCIMAGTCAREDKDTSVEVTVMHCVGLPNASRLPGGGYALRGTHSHIIELQGEVGGWRRLSAVRRCVSRKAHIHLTTWFPGSASTNFDLLNCL